jgi:hypothetical protein
LPLNGSPIVAPNSRAYRFAVLRLSNGDLTKLRGLGHHGNVDWRDVLVWAGFGNSLTAHGERARTILNEPRAP